MMADEAGAFALGDIHVNARAVNVVHEYLAAVFFRPTVALINHQARMSMAAAHGIGTAIGGVRALAAGVMKMIGNGFDIVEDVWIEVLAALPFVASALDHVPQMRNDAGFDETLSMLVEIDAPGIARAFGEELKDAPGRMETPNAGSYGRALAWRSPRFANVGMREHSMTAIEPAIWSPAKSIQSLVGILIAPAVEQYLRRAGWFGRIAVGNGDEHQIRRCPHPYSTEADLEAAHQIQSLHEHSAPIEFPIAIGIFKNEDAILGFAFFGANRIGVSLGNPEPPAMVDGEGDGLLHIRLAREKSCLKSGRQQHLARRGFRRETRKFHCVHGRHLRISGGKARLPKTEAGNERYQRQASACPRWPSMMLVLQASVIVEGLGWKVQLKGRELRRFT